MFFINNLNCRTECTLSKFAAGIKLGLGRVGLEQSTLWRAQLPFGGTSGRLRNSLIPISHFKLSEGKCKVLHVVPQYRIIL